MPQPALRLSVPLVLGIATVLGFFSTFQAANMMLVSGETPQVPVLIGLNLSYWWLWALLLPGVIWLARRFRLERHTWKRAAPVLVAGLFVFVGIHTVLGVTARVGILSLAGQNPVWWLQFQSSVFWNFDWGMMTYWTIVGVSHAIDFHRESQDRALKAAQLETRLAEAQLQALQRQLHPHFLFNTLHAISALMHRDTEAADAMLARLSDLLRLTLDRIGVQEVALRDELEFIDKYLEIERTRFGERLQVSTAIDPATLDAAVPTLMLQPLVENAIRHGIAPKRGGGRVEISARRDGDSLVLGVRDNGVGLPAATRSELSTGVGLSNTRSRLEHLYRDAFSFEFGDAPGGGLVVTIVLPFVSDAEVPVETPEPRVESVA
ncbi:MAG: sensor histidine kinase [Vicinamibacterales bacterium]